MHVLYLLQPTVAPMPAITLIEYFIDMRERYALAHWFPVCWGGLFLTFFKLYITHCRSQRCLRPFLLASQKAGFEGDPYTWIHTGKSMPGQSGALDLSPPDRRAQPRTGTGAYGQRLADAGVDELIIQRVMHHKSPASQSVYTEPPAAKIEEVLATAQQRLGSAEYEPVHIRQFLGGK
jgi:hypothetical protein